ncbi:MAG: hypothetical protein IH602_00210 [Bryobacteraceae bacterium]|nr:hypothetical protein [Bryobacteraceae bacterium]
MLFKEERRRLIKGTSTSAQQESIWHRANGVLAKDQHSLLVGILLGAVALVLTYIESGYEYAMITAVTFAGLGIQLRMFIALLNVVERGFRGGMDRGELVLGSRLLVLAISIQVITKVPLTATTAFTAVVALLLFVATKILMKLRSS